MGTIWDGTNEYWKEKKMTDSEQNEMDDLRMELANTKIELERAIVMYNDLARKSVAPDMLKRYCDNARAYGWECGKSQMTRTELPPQINSSEDNPFLNPDWDAHIKAEQAGFMLSSGDVPL